MSITLGDFMMCMRDADPLTMGHTSADMWHNITETAEMLEGPKLDELAERMTDPHEYGAETSHAIACVMSARFSASVAMAHYVAEIERLREEVAALRAEAGPVEW
jgi:hypothetical protein